MARDNETYRKKDTDPDWNLQRKQREERVSHETVHLFIDGVWEEWNLAGPDVNIIARDQVLQGNLEIAPQVT